MSTPIDVIVTKTGALVLFTPRTPTARRWIASNVDPRATRQGDAVAVEHRLIDDLVRGAIDDGLVVR